MYVVILHNYCRNIKSRYYGKCTNKGIVSCQVIHITKRSTYDVKRWIIGGIAFSFFVGMMYFSAKNDENMRIIDTKNKQIGSVASGFNQKNRPKH